MCVLRIFAAAFESDVLANDVEIKYRMKLILKQAQVSQTKNNDFVRLRMAVANEK